MGKAILTIRDTEKGASVEIKFKPQLNHNKPSQCQGAVLFLNDIMVFTNKDKVFGQEVIEALKRAYERGKNETNQSEL